METNFHKVKRLLQENANIIGFKLPEDLLISKIIEFATTPDTSNFIIDLSDFEKLSREVGYYNMKSNIKYYDEDGNEFYNDEDIKEYNKLRKEQVKMYNKMLELYSH
jgi:hypothetical protein